MASQPLQIGRGELSGIPDHLANRMMMAHGSKALLRAIKGEPEEREHGSTRAPMIPPLVPRETGYVRTADRPTRTRPQAAQRILERVAEAFGLTVDDILGRDRHRRLWIARTIAIRLMRDLDRLGDYSTSRIGDMMNNRDHSTICNALQAFTVWVEVYPEAAEIYQRLSLELGR
jgi:hypothetical protein